jgi:uncharacterized protein (DUF1499 family)
MAAKSGAKFGLAGWALLLSAGAIVGALIAALGSANGWWPFVAGLQSLRYLFFMALAGALLGLFARIRRKERHIMAAFAILLGLAMSGYLLSQYRLARSVPAIHDASTDLADPPAFITLALRRDNLESVPDEGRPGWTAMAPVERWQALHGEAYPDLKPVRLAMSPDAAIRMAEALARDRGWDVASVDPKAGHLEATATTRFFRFKDDIIVRARPVEGGSLVDVRSVSRVGRSDLGMNAKRVRKFTRDLAKG